MLYYAPIVLLYAVQYDSPLQTKYKEREMVAQPELPPEYEAGPEAIRESEETWTRMLASVYHPLMWGTLFALVPIIPLVLIVPTAPPLVLVILLLLGWFLAALAGFYNTILPNANGVLRRLNAYSRRVINPGYSFNGPWPFFTLRNEDIVSLEPVPFVLAPKDVDTYEGPESDGGQITVDLTGSLRVKYPMRFKLVGGWSKILPQAKRAIESTVRQYCAFRGFTELKHEKDSGEAAAVFRGTRESFVTFVFDKDLQVWDWVLQLAWIAISGCTLRLYLEFWGVEMYTLEVQDFTPTSESLRAAQDLPAIAKKQKAGAMVTVQALNEQVAILRVANPDASDDMLMQMAAAALGIGSLQMFNTGGGRPPIILAGGGN